MRVHELELLLFSLKSLNKQYQALQVPSLELEDLIAETEIRYREVKTHWDKQKRQKQTSQGREPERYDRRHQFWDPAKPTKQTNRPNKANQTNR